MAEEKYWGLWDPFVFYLRVLNTCFSDPVICFSSLREYFLILSLRDYVLNEYVFIESRGGIKHV